MPSWAERWATRFGRPAPSQPARLGIADWVAALFVCGGLLAVDQTISAGALGVQVTVAVAAALITAVRRSTPAAALMLMTLVLAVQLTVLGEIKATDAALLLVLHSSWSWGAAPTRVAAAVIAFGASILAGLATPFSVAPSSGASAILVVATVFAVASGACGMGLLSRTRRALTAELRVRAERAEADQQRVAELAAARERARMARDVHDVVAHSLTLIAVQAQVGSFTASTQPEDSHAAETLESIAGTAKDALVEVRSVLRALRTTNGSVTLDLTGPIGQAEDAGLGVDTNESGAPRPLSILAAHAVKHLVREALTNTLRHAGPKARVVVELTWTLHALHIVVEDAGGEAPSRPCPGGPPGLGLVGMRERITAVGGQLQHGHHQNGFRIAAIVPAP